MLRQLDSSLWVSEAPFTMLRINFGNRMTCLQLTDKSIWLHSPVAYREDLHKQIQVIGKIACLIAPSLMHNLYVMDWKQHETDCQVLAPSGAKKVQADITLDNAADEKIARASNGEIECIPIAGMPMLQEFAFIHKASGTLILTDLAFNFSTDVKGWTRFFLKMYGAYNKCGPTRTIRALIRDKDAFTESLRRIAARDFERINVSHGNIVERNGHAMFLQAFQQYL